MADYTQNGDYNLTSSVEVLAYTPTAAGWYTVSILVGDGVKDPVAASGTWQATITHGAAVSGAGPQDIVKGAEQRARFNLGPYWLDASEAFTVDLLSDAGGDTDVDVTVNVDNVARPVLNAIGSIGAATGGALAFPADDDNVGGVIDPSSTAFVGVETSGSDGSTQNRDEVYHNITHSGNAIDIVYYLPIGNERTGVDVSWTGYLNSSNDSCAIYAYNFVGTAWEQVAKIVGTNGTANQTVTAPLLSRHTGTGSELGNCYIRIACTGQTAPDLFTDHLYISAVNFSLSVGYALGAIWVDTSASNTNVTPFVDGVADNPVSTWTAALTLAAAVGLSKFELAAGSSITLSANSDSYVINARGATIALGGQSVSGATITGATITGNDDGSNTLATSYTDCIMGDNVLGLHSLHACGLSGSTTGVTMAEAGTYDWDQCYSRVAGTGTPLATFTSGANQNLNMRHYSGGIQFEAMGDGGSTCNASLEGFGQFKEGTCTAGTVSIRGAFPVSGITNLTLSDDARLSDVALETSVQTVISTGSTGPWTSGSVLANNQPPVVLSGDYNIPKLEGELVN